MKFILSIFIFLIVFELIAFDPSFQDYLITKNSNMDDASIKHEQILNFFQGSPLPNMTEREASHMQDVKRLHNIFLAVIIIFALLMPFWEIEIFSTIVIIILTAISLIIPNQIFQLFHLIFFPQGNFSFPSNSFLITLYPETFFFELAYWWFFISITILLCLFLYKKIYISKRISSGRND